LLLSQNGKNAQAEKLFKQALITEPQNGEVLYALTILYIQQKQYDKAMQSGRILNQYHGGNPAYQDLLTKMKLK
jgi:Tfp pilus assembly protein PilF